MPDARPTFICITPVRNEAWILERFLRCAATWADHIVIADQHSDDGSREIAAAHPKVTLVDNPSREYDEAARQRILLEAARAIPAAGRRILIALDADEALTANWMESLEWARVADAAPGTVVWFDWVNVAPGAERGWIPPTKLPLGLVDDGRPHGGGPIHNARIPVVDGGPALMMEEVKALHYQYVDWARMRSKQRWYQCWERVHLPEKRPITLYRQYHHMDPAAATARPLRPEWTAGYERLGIDMKHLPAEGGARWDREVLALLDGHGASTFRRLDVWDIDWSALSAAEGRPRNGALRDPRTAVDRVVLSWLARTQATSHRLPVRAIQRLLRLARW
jgi:hypothetical protein